MERNLREVLMRGIFLALLLISFTARAGDTVRLVFIGDVMQHREQLKNAHIHGQDTLNSSSYDYSGYFRYTSHRFRSANLAIANMEFPCAAAPYRGYPAFSAPASLAAATKDAGIDVFLCANNHICDRKARGIRSTLDCYDSLGVFRTGLYRDSSDMLSKYPLVMNVEGWNGGSMRIALINFTYGTNGIRVPKPYLVSQMDTLQVKTAVARAKSKGAEYIIALPHWGEEYHLTPSENQRWWQRFLFRCGVNAIVGSHPHVVQPMERSEEGVTVFSLGNFISNMSAANTQAGWLFTLELARDGDERIRECGAVCEMIWCPRNRGPLDGWTTVMIDDFKDSPEKFKSRAEYDKMMNTFVKLLNPTDGGNGQ